MTIYSIMDWMVDYTKNETNRIICNLDDINNFTYIQFDWDSIVCSKWLITIYMDANRIKIIR